ncbi:MAG: DUF3566 domain-containing protein [Actinotalea sp.]|nr:DUF3566 domain-containing protein [Actinotalea sp.]
MSTDGTQSRPTSPATPAGPGVPPRGSVRTTDKPSSGDPRTQARPAQGDARTATDRPAVPRADGASARDADSTPSVADRLKAAGAAAGAAVAGAMNRDDRPTGTRPAAATAREEAAPAVGPRRVRLALARIDPWSVMKLSFLLSFAVGIMMVVAAAVVWMTLDAQGVFAQVDQTITEITGNPDFFPMEEYVAFDRVMALATIIAIVDVVLLTALATIGAFLYNIVAALVGGIHMTLTDD